MSSKGGATLTKKMYTVLRGPHIRISREQSGTRIQTQMPDNKAERDDLRNKLFWLRRRRLIGRQFEVQVLSKTLLDPKLWPPPQSKK